MSARLIFLDDHRGRFGPLTRLRPIEALRTGALTTRQRVERRLRHHPAGDTLWVNPRWTGVGLPEADTLPANHAIRTPAGELIIARADRPDADPDALASSTADVALMERPWHILDQLEAALAHDLALFPQRVADDAAVHPSAVIDESHGPVVIDSGVTVGPLAVLQGPCYIGANCVIRPHGCIRPNTVLGPVCSVGGEVGGTIIDSYSNKAHTGFLGNALLGRWINLGADTTASNLKNTYGHVRVQLDAEHPAEDSGRLFMGPIMGDYVRTAIGTRINTGSVFDVAVMYAASPFTPKYTPPCRFITDAGSEAYAPDKLLATVRAAMSRRNVTLDDQLEAKLRALCMGSGQASA